MINNETVQIWLDDLLEMTGKATLAELTADELSAEVEEVKGTIENEKIWGNEHNIIDLEEYLCVLNKMLAGKEM